MSIHVSCQCARISLQCKARMNYWIVNWLPFSLGDNAKQFSHWRCHRQCRIKPVNLRLPRVPTLGFVRRVLMFDSGMNGRSYLIVILIFFSLIFNDTEYLLIPFLAAFLPKISVHVPPSTFNSFLHPRPSNYDHFPSAWSSFFSVSFRVGWLVLNSFHFFLEMSLFLPSSVKDRFILYRILNWQLLYFTTLKILVPCLQASIVAVGKLAVSCCFFKSDHFFPLWKPLIFFLFICTSAFLLGCI